MKVYRIDDFDHWRTLSRKLLAVETEPASLKFIPTSAQQGLFDEPIADELPTGTGQPQGTAFSVPRRFLSLAEDVGYHRNDDRWNLLYRMLWRLTHGEPHLLQLSTDDDVLQCRRMQKQVSRDAHKAKAFVRFRKVLRDAQEHFIAWHQPDHRIVRKVAPFFSRRFKGMNWTILTPDESVSWDQKQLVYFEGVPRSEAPDSDELEQLWKTYYASIFNPARVKVDMMKSEMPVRYWKTLPEAELIDDLIADAPSRVSKLIEQQRNLPPTASQLIDTVEPERRTLESLRTLASECQACSLHEAATQTIFGRGNVNASLVIVGEQPGDEEDVAGEPFVGPAGQLLRAALAEAGIDVDSVYLTNTVKHFKFRDTPTPQGKRRLHQRPNAREISCCRPWLEAELKVIRPEVLVLLGRTALQAMDSRLSKMADRRGQVFETEYCPRTTATWHPASILRLPDAVAAEQRRCQLVEDLRRARSLATEQT